MPSVVAEVLSSAGSLDKADLAERLEQLELKVSESRAAICESLKGKWVEFVPEALARGEELIDRTNQLNEETENEINRVKAELRSRSRSDPKEVAKVNDRLKEIDNDLIAVTNIVELGDLFDRFNTTFTNETPMGATDMVRQMQEKISEIDVTKKFVSDRVFSAMKEEFSERKERLVYELLELWNAMFVWKLQPECITLTIQLTPHLTECTFANDFETVKEALSALDMLGELTKKLKTFATSLLKHFCFPLIRTEVANFECKCESDVKTAIISLERKPVKVDQSKDTSKPSAPVVIEQLHKLFSTLNIVMLNLDVLTVHDSGSNSRNFMSLLGEHLSGPLMESLVKECLKSSIPDHDTAENVKEFNRVLQLAEGLVEKLKSFGVVGKSEMPLQQYAENLDSLFADKKCSHILMRARDLIKQELHDSVLLQPKTEEVAAKDLQDHLSSASNETGKDQSGQLKFDVDERLPPVFHFPRCRVSKTTLDLFNLVVETLMDASSSSPQKAGRLVLTARNIFEIYIDVVLIYHNRSIETLPNVAALFYNNTMYLAHQLLTLGVEFGPRLARVLGSDRSCPLTFIDFIPRLRQLATECLDTVLEKQKSQMDECLKGANDFRLTDDKNSYQCCDRALKQVMLQLEHLNRIWMEVLTHSVMFRAQGVLVSHLFDYLLNCLFKLEDISADDATVYAGLFTGLLKKTELLFKVDKQSEIAAFCDRDYMRFKEILLMLQGSLMDINDRWAAGKGPLATYCSALEVKGLIRALFQNTEKRAAILAHIK